MRLANCDTRPRIHIEANRDGATATWRKHPRDKGHLAPSPGAALDAALAEIEHAPAVIIWEGPPP